MSFTKTKRLKINQKRLLLVPRQSFKSKGNAPYVQVRRNLFFHKIEKCNLVQRTQRENPNSRQIQDNQRPSKTKNRKKGGKIQLHVPKRQRDAPWLQFYVESHQDLVDTILLAFRVAEDERVLLLPILRWW